MSNSPGSTATPSLRQPPDASLPTPSMTRAGGHRHRPWPGLACLGAQPPVYGLKKAMIPGPSRHRSQTRPGPGHCRPSSPITPFQLNY